MAEPVDQDLNMTEALALYALAARSGPVPNADLKRYGPELRKTPHRDRLEAAGLIEVTKGPRGAISMTLTERGWGRCERMMTAPPPPGANPATRTLFTVLQSAHRQLVRDGKGLGEILCPADEQADVPLAGPADPGTVESRIRAAIAALTPEPDAWVSIHRLRSHLAEVARSDLDAALTALYGSDGVEIVADSNLKALTDEAREGAVRIGRRDRHVMRILR